MQKRYPQHARGKLVREIVGIGVVLLRLAAQRTGHHINSHEKAAQESNGKAPGQDKEPSEGGCFQLPSGKERQDGGDNGHEPEGDGQEVHRQAPEVHFEHAPEIAEDKDGTVKGRSHGQEKPKLQDGIGGVGKEYGRQHEQVGKVAQDDRLPGREIVVHVPGIGLAAVSPAHCRHKDACGHVNGKRGAEQCILQG